MKRARAALLSALLVLLVLPATAVAAEAAGPAGEARILRFPDIHGDTVVFSRRREGPPGA